ncbi:MAG: GntR family transcriptional regulator [Acetobacteraceae bacterium]
MAVATRRIRTNAADGRLAARAMLSAETLGWPVTAIRTKEHQVAEILRENIFAGIFVRGQKLKQAEIAKTLNISITPVREALKLLEAQGYVRCSAHRGAVVAPLQIDRIDELYQLRMSLEGTLTLAAAKRIGAADIERLATLHADMGVAIERKTRETVRASNFRFHYQLYEHADMPQTLEFVRVLWAKYPFDLLSAIPRRFERMAAEHAELIHALRSGDARKAMRAMQAHIEGGYREFTATYDLERPQKGPRIVAERPPRAAAPRSRPTHASDRGASDRGASSRNTAQAADGAAPVTTEEQ